VPVSGRQNRRSVLEFLARPAAILRGYRPADLPADVIAGLTVAAVGIPQAVAYASIAELPPHFGLNTAAIAGIVGSLWGSSRFLATGPVNAVSLVALPILLSIAPPGTPQFLLAAGTLAVMAGLLNIVLAVMRFGALVTLASRAVLLGFTAGAAVHIAIGQARHLLGIDIPATPELYRTLGAIFSAAGAFHWPTVALGLGALGVLIALRRLGRRVPAELLAIAAAAVAVHFLALADTGMRLVGAIPRTLPALTWISFGPPNLQMIQSLLVGSMAVAALGLVEAVASAKALARRHGDPLDSNQEFFGQGLANIAAGLLSGYPCSGSFTRSALSQQAGARSHLAGVFAGLSVLVGMFLLAPFAQLVPRAAIAGVLLAVAWRMIDWQGIRRAAASSRPEAATMGLTFIATLVLPLDFAVLTGIVFSLAFFIIKSSLPRIYHVVPDPTYRHLIHSPERPLCPQLGVVNIRGPLFFGAVHHLEEELRHSHEDNPGQNHMVVRMHGVDFCDLSGIEMLESMVQSYRKTGGDVYLIRPRRPVLEVMEHSGFIERIGKDHILEQEGAIEHIFENVLDPMVCIHECEHRVFAECQALEKNRLDDAVPPTSVHFHHHRSHVPPAEFVARAERPGALVIDVREPDEFAAGHVPDARLLPLRCLCSCSEEGRRDLPRDRTLLLVCRSGRRTSRALCLLEAQGFTKTYGLKGGMLAWRAEGLPVAASAETPEIWIPDRVEMPAPVGYSPGDGNQGPPRPVAARLRPEGLPAGRPRPGRPAG
jgi:SulP family sulfate permease